MGTFDKVSKKDLSLYVVEFQFHYNNRNNPDIFGAAIQGVLTEWHLLKLKRRVGGAFRVTHQACVATQRLV